MSQSRRITPQTSLDNLKKEAKRWLKQLRAGDPEALALFAHTAPQLREVQHALALEYGFHGWTALKKALATPDALAKVAELDQLAAAMVDVYATGDASALERINQHYRDYGRTVTVDDFRATVWRLMYKVRRAKGAAEAFHIPEAQELISRTAGFGNWDAMTVAVSTGVRPSLPIYGLSPEDTAIWPQRDLTEREWDILLDVMQERRIPELRASGFANDRVLRRVAEFDFVKTLMLEGSRAITDEGMQQLARMPQLESLEHPSGSLTDRSLEVLRHLPNLRQFKMNWAYGISDEGIAHLKYCERIEDINIMGSSSGDGLIEAMQGKVHLSKLHTGRLVTDAGVALLHGIPLFRAVGDIETSLLIDGPFSNDGLMKLAGLDGLKGLDLFWHVTGITSAGFQVLQHLKNLERLGCDGELCSNETMRHIAAAPRLKRLRAQGSFADDDGFAALSKSRSLESFWGREAPGLGNRGFIALSTIPTLKDLGISLANVDNAGLSHLPNFPALRRLTPIDVKDDGFRYVGRCTGLEDLSCMYCRETGDIATQHVAGLQLKKYYAGLTLITDRSLELFANMHSLEDFELFETKSVTDAGLAAIANLPNLRKVELSGLPLVTYQGTRVFPARVHVNYDV